MTFYILVNVNLSYAIFSPVFLSYCHITCWKFSSQPSLKSQWSASHKSRNTLIALCSSSVLYIHLVHCKTLQWINDICMPAVTVNIVILIYSRTIKKLMQTIHSKATWIRWRHEIFITDLLLIVSPVTSATLARLINTIIVFFRFVYKNHRFTGSPIRRPCKALLTKAFTRQIAISKLSFTTNNNTNYNKSTTINKRKKNGCNFLSLFMMTTEKR